MGKKQIPLRISEELFNDLAVWADNDFRSLNGQIEFLLSQCVKQHKRNGAYISKEIESRVNFDINDFEKDG